MSSFFPDGAPQLNIFCMRCSHQFMLCGCTGLGHGQAMYYALPKVPDSMSKETRLERFAVLLQFHPLLNVVAMERLYADKGGLSSIVASLSKAEPILRRLMEAYKESTEFREGVPMNQMDAAALKQVRTDCDIAIREFFACNWGQIKLFEWILLNNAVQTQCNPEDFTGESLEAMKLCMDIISLMMGVYEQLKPGGEGTHNLNYQLEDVM